MKRKVLYVVILFFAILGVLYAVTYSFMKENEKPLNVYGNPGHKVIDFKLIDQQGDTVTQKILDGKVSVVEYFYTTCTGICIPMNKNMDKVYQDLKDLPDFQILSNTVDPTTDNVSVLAAYAKSFNADPSVWKFLTGPKDQIFTTAVKGYLLNAADSIGVNDQYVHTQWFALVDQKRQIRGFYDGLKDSEISRLKQDVKRLLKDGPQG